MGVTWEADGMPINSRHDFSGFVFVNVRPAALRGENRRKRLIAEPAR